MRFDGETITAHLKGWREYLGFKSPGGVVFTATEYMAYIFRRDTGITLGVVSEESLKGS